MTEKYLRDKRSPTPKNENTSRVMSANKGKDSKPEITLRKKLWNEGLKGYRLHYKKIPGRPDICFVSKKVAIFVNGCFWHRCPKCNYSLPKNNTEFWIKKFNANKERDLRKIKQLNDLGWSVLTFWECEIKKDIEAVIKTIETTLNA